MSKESTQNKIMEAIKLRGDGFQVLNKNGNRINHVRVHCFGDVWPTTGTAKLSSGEWIRKNPDKLVGKLRKIQGKAKDKPENPKEDRLAALEGRVKELEEGMEYLIKNLEEINEAMKI